ncbi:hypothetical protein, partial [Paracoccus salsus]|uniref:hypothetical protein n=1 Tax=Paracoccus salsus TaxID=2911061 RepID=UPI001F15DE08
QNPYNTDLDRNPANFQPLTPLNFLERAANVFPAGWLTTRGRHENQQGQLGVAAAHAIQGRCDPAPVDQASR